MTDWAPITRGDELELARLVVQWHADGGNCRECADAPYCLTLKWAQRILAALK